jgi:hypothetical protein
MIEIIWYQTHFGFVLRTLAKGENDVYLNHQLYALIMGWA